jgi:hypothetical protein
MSNPAPVPGMCNARTRDTHPETGERGYCANHPARGKTRCRKHGGAPGSGRPIIHGLYSKSQRSLSEYGQKRMEVLLQDPDLLDLRRMAAYGQFAIEQAILEPTEHAVLRVALSMVNEPENITDEVLLEARQKIMLAALRMLRDLTAIIKEAHRQEHVTELLLQGAMPLVQVFAERVKEAAYRYMAPEKRSEFDSEVQQIVHILAGELALLGDEGIQGA